MYYEIKIQLTSPSSPGSAEVTAKSFPLESKALISMPQLVSGCRSHTLNTCLTSILCQELTPALTSIFRDRIRICLFPSVAGIRREMSRNTVVASSAGRRWTHSCARKMRLAWIFWAKEKKQHFGCPFSWTTGSAGETRGESVLEISQTEIKSFIQTGLIHFANISVRKNQANYSRERSHIDPVKLFEIVWCFLNHISKIKTCWFEPHVVSIVSRSAERAARA